jgi:3-oxoadipate enol-lactonase
LAGVLVGGTFYLPKAKVGDLNIYYEIHGDGFPLVMISGLSSNIDWWDPRIIQETSKKSKTIVFDNRDTGRTEKSKAGYTIKKLADDTAGLMNALKIQRSNILGISMGGMIAQEFALNYPKMVEKLLLLSTTCGGPKSVSPPPQLLELLTKPREGISPEEMAKMAIPIIFTGDYIKSNPVDIKQFTQRILKIPIAPDAYMRQIGAIMTHDTYNRLPSIKAPTLVMAGNKDILVMPQNSKILAERIPGAKLVYLDKSAHLLFPEMFEKAISTVIDFLK